MGMGTSVTGGHWGRSCSNAWSAILRFAPRTRTKRTRKSSTGRTTSLFRTMSISVMRLRIWFAGMCPFRVLADSHTNLFWILRFSLITSPDKRLTVEGLKTHSFFYGVDWAMIRQIDAPFVPHLKSIIDTSYFPTEDLENVPDQPAGADGSGANKDLAFLGYVSLVHGHYQSLRQHHTDILSSVSWATPNHFNGICSSLPTHFTPCIIPPRCQPSHEEYMYSRAALRGQSRYMVVSHIS